MNGVVNSFVHGIENCCLAVGQIHVFYAAKDVELHVAPGVPRSLILVNLDFDSTKRLLIHS